jgi:glycine dehydrogenase
MLPDFSIEDIKKYYQKLNDINVSPDDNIYPLGSCTMKYNPYINDWAAGLSGFTRVHPQSPIENVQGSLKILFEIQEIFKSITGLPAVTTQPVAGAQGELVGLKLFQAYHADRGEGHTRNIILIPKSAHGTNPATATMAGYRTYNENGVSYGIVTIQANGQGQIDMEQVKKLVEEYSTRIAAVMVTNPNTSGIFETDFKKMSDLIHSVGGLVYMDGANMNAIAGWVDLDKMGVDAVHNNLHKTWSIPHGGGGPGDGIVAVSEKLIPYLPGHTVIFSEGKYTLHKAAKSIGEFHRHFGNFAHKIRAYTYIKALGEIGTRRMSGMSVLAARYLYSKLQNSFPILPENTENNPRMHEFILTLSKETFDKIEKSGTPKASTIARVGKLFLDFGGHAPTVAFPEVYGLMIEPTETYSKLELDKFVEVVNSILALVNENPEVLKTAPHFTPVKKVDEVYANKELKFMDNITELFTVFDNVIDPIKLSKMETYEVASKIREVNKSRLHS